MAQTADQDISMHRHEHARPQNGSESPALTPPIQMEGWEWRPAPAVQLQPASGPVATAAVYQAAQGRQARPVEQGTKTSAGRDGDATGQERAQLYAFLRTQAGGGTSTPQAFKEFRESSHQAPLPARTSGQDGHSAAEAWKLDQSKFWAQKPVIVEPTPIPPPSIVNYQENLPALRGQSAQNSIAAQVNSIA